MSLEQKPIDWYGGPPITGTVETSAEVQITPARPISAMTPDDLEAIRQVVREELERVFPPAPEGMGTRKYDEATHRWVAR